jgi:hypothetical protein
VPITVDCRTCGETFEAPDRLAGGTGPCAICGAPNAVPRRNLPRAAAEIEPVERDGLSKVAVGLTLVLTATYLLVVFSLLMGIAAWIEAGDLLFPLARLAPLVAVVYPVLMIVGQAFCLFVPERSRAQGIATAGLVCNALTALLQLAFVLGGGMPFWWFATLGLLFVAYALIATIGGALFVLFLARTARFLHDEKTEAKAMAALYLGAAIVGAYLFAGLALVGGRDGMELRLVFGVVLVVLGLVWLLKYVGAVSGLRWRVRVET